jgi:hypothetical protein
MLISGTASNTAICKIKKNTKTNGVVSTNGNITNIENNITFFEILDGLFRILGDQKLEIRKMLVL